MFKKEEIKDRVGKVYINNKGESFIILEYRDSKDIDIQFKDGTILTGRGFSDILKGKAKNPNSPTICGIGYVGQGKHLTSINGKHTKAYSYWRDMLSRCYSEKYFIEQGSYKDVDVCKEWHNFQNFAKWFQENWKSHMEKWQLDKDILIKGNKIYSPETCCFVTSEINSIIKINKSKRGELPIGIRGIEGRYRASFSKNNRFKYIGTFSTKEEAFQAYKTAKEEWIKELANKYRGQITEKCYQALIKYQVEITD